MDRYDTYCGLYCGACEIINAETAEDRERVGEFWGAQPEQVHCTGCKTDTVFIHCEHCPIRICAQDKSVDFCLDCGEYPCAIYEEGKEIIEYLPHLKATVINQKYIRKHGVERWLVDQKSKWECPECESRFAWYTEECRNCGKDLKGLKDYENMTKGDLTL